MSLAMVNMEELQLAAKAYFKNSTSELQNCARHFFNSMDADGDGVVSSTEFAAFLQQNGYGWVGGSDMFSRLDANRDGSLDFWEAMAFYYLVKTRCVCCDSCVSLLPGLYFTCVTCFDAPGTTINTFDLCASCYGGRRFSHGHSMFVDSYVLLRSKIGISPGFNVNTAVTQPQPDYHQPAESMTNRWFQALKAAMEVILPGQAQQQQQQQVIVAEKLNDAVQQQLNLQSVKIRALSLLKSISRILEDFDVFARTNSNPKWQDILGQYSMVNLELFNIVDEIKKVSKAFVVQPKNVNAENSTILPVMLSSKLLPEMEVDDNAKREQLLHGMQSLPVTTQIEKLKARIDMIGAACEGAEKVLADTRKAYCFGTRQGVPILPTLDKGQAAKIHEQENLLRASVNHGDGLRLPGDQRQVTPTSLPMHLVDVLTTGDGMQNFPEPSGNNQSSFQGVYMKPNLSLSNSLAGPNPMMQVPGSQLLGRSAASPGGPTASFENMTNSPMPYANSPKSGTMMMNTPSPQQQQQSQQLQQPQQQQLNQRQKLMQLPQHQQQQILAQQQYRHSAMQGLGGQTQLPQLHDLQSQQKFQPMQYSQAMGHQQFQARQLASGHVQHGIGQSQLNQGTQMNRHLNQFSGTANTALFNAAQTSNPQMIPNMSGTMSSTSLLPRMQYGLPSNNPQRTHASQMLNDQMFNMGAGNPGGMMTMQQQQPQQGTFGNMAQTAQNIQPGNNMASLQTNPQTHPNFGQQRQQQNQQ